MKWLALLLLAMLGGCTNDTIATARLVDGQLVFSMPDTVACLDHVTLSDTRRTELWVLGDPGSGSRSCGALYSHRLSYGDALKGVPTSRPAQSLVPGESYMLLGSPGLVIAAFRYNGTATAPTNFAPGSEDWCTIRYPCSKPDWLGQCRIK